MTEKLTGKTDTMEPILHRALRVKARLREQGIEIQVGSRYAGDMMEMELLVSPLATLSLLEMLVADLDQLSGKPGPRGAGFPDPFSTGGIEA